MRAECASSSTHSCSRSQLRIKLSCEMSITVSVVSATPAGGIRNERPPPRNTSMTAMTSAGSLRRSRKFSQTSRAADLAIVRASFSQGFEKFFGDHAAAFVWQFGIRFIGVTRQRFGHRADGFVMSRSIGSPLRRCAAQWSQVRISACCRIGS